MRLFRQQKGTVSVLLTLLLIPTLLVSGLVTDAARVYGAKGMISDAGQLALNAGLTYYDTGLKDNYGLFAISKGIDELDIEKYFVNTINASNLEGAKNISHLIDLSASDGLDVYGVPGSEVYYTEVEKAQILEYMKYRAPVMLGVELWDKLKEIKEAKSQVEALEKQADFAEKLESLDDRLQSTRNALDKYTEREDEITREKIALAEAEAKKLFESGTKHLLMATSAPTVTQDVYSMDFMTLYTNFTEEAAIFKDALNTATQDDAGLSALYDSHYVTCAGYYRALCEAAGSEGNLESYIRGQLEANGITDVNAAYESFSENYGVINEYAMACSALGKSEIEQGVTSLRTLYAMLSVEEQYIKDAIQEVEKIEGSLKKVETSYTQWSDQVSQLNEGDFKENQESAASEYEGMFTEDEINDFKSKLEADKAYIEAAKQYLESYSYMGKQCVGSGTDESASDISNLVAGQSIEANSLSEVTAKTSELVRDRLVTPGEGISGSSYRIQDENFYKHLKEMCEEDTSQSGKKEENKSKASEIFKMNDFVSVEVDIAELASADWDGIAKPSELLNAQNAPDDTENQISIDNTADASSKSSRKDAISNAKQSLNSMKNFLSQVENILSENIENLYLMEYSMQMFSYYTVDKNSDGTAKAKGEITSMSGDDLTKHKMYKSEAEYILWGKEKAQENINATRLLLYGVRFVFGLIYAFSDSEINNYTRSIAEGLSCGVAILVPIIHFVLNVAVGAAEAAFDVKDLMLGKAVPLIKNSSNSYVGKLLGRGNGKKQTFTMNYKEYMCVFMMLHMYGEFETSALARMADCIQLNEKADITKSYTMLAVNADVKLRTTFLRKASSWSGRNSITSDTYTISYKSCLGY